MGELMKLSQIERDTEIAIPTAEGPIALSVASVLKWIAPTAPPREALKFVLTCRAARVNPLLKEAHLVEYGGQWSTIIDKSGWLRRANEHPQYDGFEAGLILRPIDASTKPPTPIGPPEYHEGAVQPAGYQLLGGWARVYRKDRTRPVYEAVSLGEYINPKSPNWRDRPCMMIRKVALVQALREAGFLTSGAYDQDEMPAADDEAFNARPVAHPPADPAIHKAIDVEFEVVPTHQLDGDLAAEMEDVIRRSGMTDWQRDQMLAKRGVASIVELNTHDAREIIGKLQHRIDQRDAGQILLPDPAPAPDDGTTAVADDFAIPAATRGA